MFCDGEPQRCAFRKDANCPTQANRRLEWATGRLNELTAEDAEGGEDSSPTSPTAGEMGHPASDSSAKSELEPFDPL